jgi:23S rRNA (adenine2030-N6)-methyltransferase
VLTDPPYEQPDEFARVAAALAGAHRKWPTGVYMVWYPIKDPRAAEAFGRDLARRGIPRMLRAELDVAPVRADEKLAGSGLVILNPPFGLEAELAVLLPALAGALAVEQGASRLDWLAGEK